MSKAAERLELKILTIYWHHAHGKPLPDPVLPIALWPLQDEPLLAYASLHKHEYLEGGMPERDGESINTDSARITEKGIEYMRHIANLPADE